MFLVISAILFFLFSRLINEIIYIKHWNRSRIKWIMDFKLVHVATTIRSALEWTLYVYFQYFFHPFFCPFTWWCSFPFHMRMRKSKRVICMPTVSNIDIDIFRHDSKLKLKLETCLNWLIWETYLSIFRMFSFLLDYEYRVLIFKFFQNIFASKQLLWFIFHFEKYLSQIG